MARAAGSDEDLSSFDRFVHSYRHTMFDDQLVAKRAELETLLPELQALEAKNPKAPPPPKPPRERPILPPINRRKVAMAAVAIAALWIVVPRVAARLMEPKPPPPPVELAPVTRRPVREVGELFFSREVEMTYKGGQVIISGEPQVTGQFWVDDKIVLYVTHPDDTVQTWEKSFNEACRNQNQTAPPQDITNLFAPGVNKIKVEMWDVCGAQVGTLNQVLLTEIER
jgi:hypothetical protein